MNVIHSLFSEQNTTTRETGFCLGKRLFLWSFKMKIERPVENWTKYPNCILDNLDKFSPPALKVLSLMVRKNLGYQTPNKTFSLSYISKKINLSRDAVNRALKELLRLQSIKIIGSGKRGVNLFDILWEVPLVRENDQSVKHTGTSTGNITELVRESDSLKENTVLYNKVKENSPYASFCIELIEYWNNRTLQSHNYKMALKKLSEKKCKEHLELYSMVQWENIIKNYSDIVNSSEYWYSNKTQIWYFVSRGHYEKFIETENYSPFENFKIDKKQKQRFR